MKELTLGEILANAFTALVNSEVFILVILELAILLLAMSFSKVTHKKVIKVVATTASLVVAGFYAFNYIDTISTFLDNATTRAMEYLYFPTTLEFVVTMIISFIIMIVTLLNKKEKLIVKVINVAIPVIISFLFFSIIEYMNGANIAFNEYAIYTEPVLMSLNETAIGLFAAWIVSLLMYKLDSLIIKKVNAKRIVEDKVLYVDEIKLDEQQTSNTLVTVSVDSIPAEEDEEEIEMPRLKSQLL